MDLYLYDFFEYFKQKYSRNYIRAFLSWFALFPIQSVVFPITTQKFNSTHVFTLSSSSESRKKMKYEG